MPQETELKLSVHADDLPGLLAHPLLKAQAPRRERLRNTYFDTSTLALRAQRVAVRERRVGRRTLLTVKTAGTSVGGLSRRGEWEAPSRPGAFDFAALVDDEALAQQLAGLAWQLVPVFCTDLTRRTWRLAHGQAEVEMALDQGFIATGSHRQPILELELELLSGPVDGLLDLAHTLALGPAGRAAQGLRLLPANLSKAERGYALFMGERLGPRKAARLQLSPGMHPVQAFRVAALDCLAHLQANEAGVCEPMDGSTALPDPEFVHQARVALRRLRTGLRLFHPHLPPRFVQHWAVEWKRLATELGDARDWDVFATEWLPILLAETPPQDAREGGQAALLEWVAAERRGASRRAALALSDRAHALRLLAFTGALLRLSPADPLPGEAVADAGLTPWAREVLRERHARLQREARRARRFGPEGRHALRLVLKKLRYAQEFLGGLLPPRRMARAIEDLAAAQALLGRLNDLSTAEALLARAPEGPGAAIAGGWRRELQSRLEAGLQDLPAMERALERLPTA